MAREVATGSTSAWCLIALAGGGGIAAATLSSHAATVASKLSDSLGHGWTPIESWVEIVVLIPATLGAAWLTLSALVGLAVLVANRLGGGWRTGEAAVWHLTPRLVRRFVCIGAGVSLGIGSGLGVAATPEPKEPPLALRPSAVLIVPGQLDPLPPPVIVEAAVEMVEPVIPTAHEITTDTPEKASDDEERIVVVAGDCLWRIAARALGLDATNAEILAATNAWYQQNRDVIGPNPDLIHPGQVLTRPPNR